MKYLTLESIEQKSTQLYTKVIDNQKLLKKYHQVKEDKKTLDEFKKKQRKINII